jgi:phage shock protein C
METKKLTRSQTDRWLAGVCGGIAEYSGIDPTVVRLVYLVLALVTVFFPFAILYVVAAIIMPSPQGALTAAPPATPLTANTPTLSATPFVPAEPQPARTAEMAAPPGDGSAPSA